MTTLLYNDIVSTSFLSFHHRRRTQDSNWLLLILYPILAKVVIIMLALGWEEMSRVIYNNDMIQNLLKTRNGNDHMSVMWWWICHVAMLFCRVELEAEIRLRVDELMREELKNLKLVCWCRHYLNVILLTGNWERQRKR